MTDPTLDNFSEAYGKNAVALEAVLFSVLLNLANVAQTRKLTEEKMRSLSGRLLQVQDEERRRIARDLHDAAGQTLSALKMTIHALAQKIPLEESTLKLFDDLRALTDQAADEIRTSSYLLHPPLLDEVGFAAAAEWFLEGLAKRSGIPIKFDCETAKRMPPVLEIVLFRILQESLTNIHRHSGSQTAEVTLKLVNVTAILTVRDHGRGIPEHVLDRLHQSGSSGGVGLAGMAERVREVGGELQIESDSSGTNIIAKIPMPNNGEKLPITTSS